MADLDKVTDPSRAIQLLDLTISEIIRKLHSAGVEWTDDLVADFEALRHCHSVLEDLVYPEC